MILTSVGPDVQEPILPGVLEFEKHLKTGSINMTHEERNLQNKTGNNFTETSYDTKSG